jgi:hypothetical protein
MRCPLRPYSLPYSLWARMIEWAPLLGAACCEIVLGLGGTAHADTRFARPAGIISSAPAAFATSMPPDNAGLLCRHAIQIAGRAAGIPDHLMSAIGRVESGRRGPDGQVHPWPWSINAEGVDHVFDTREQAISAVRALQAQGMRSIDIGCMQVNLLHHPTAFATLEQAFDPPTNATYAARFLSQLYAQTGSWPKATALYHSATPELGSAYQQKVTDVLAEETLADGRSPGLGLMNLRSASIGPGMGGGMGGGMMRGGMGPGALMLSSRAVPARILPQDTPGAGRGLDAYRAAPVRMVGRAGS